MELTPEANERSSHSNQKYDLSTSVNTEGSLHIFLVYKKRICKVKYKGSHEWRTKKLNTAIFFRTEDRSIFEVKTVCQTQTEMRVNE